MPISQIVTNSIANGAVTPADLSTGAPVWDTSGNVGIGTSSPEFADSRNGLAVKGATANGAEVIVQTSADTGSVGLALVKFGNDTAVSNRSNGNMLFGTNNLERMRIDSSGNFLFGATSRPSGVNGAFYISGTLSVGAYQTRAGGAGAWSGNGFNINWTGSPQLWIDVTNIGTIAFTSDYRIKRNIQTQTALALERVMALRPVTYQMADYSTLFKATEDIKEGFIAHEVQEVIPSGAEGVKDDENQIQSLRVDAILAVAVKAIQELKAELDTVKAELATLKGTV